MVAEITGKTGLGFRTYMAKLSKLCQKSSTWTPLQKAEMIMHRQVHHIHQVCVHLGLRPTFEEQNVHLRMVPYSEEELTWAAKNGVVLTLHASSVRRLSLLSEDGLEVSSEVWQNCPDMALRGPWRASWYLALRQMPQSEELRILCHQPKMLRKRMRIADVGHAATSAYLDSAIYGIVPTALRMTESVVLNEFESRRVFVGGPTRGKMAKIQVIAGQGYAQYPQAVVWKPHPIPAL